MGLVFEDKTITCKDCGESFVFTAGEQGFYLEKGLINEPQLPRTAPAGAGGWCARSEHGHLR